MINHFETEYSSEESQESAGEKQRKVQSIVKTNIKQETAGQKIENMLAINFIKATDKNFQKRKKIDYLKTQTESFSRNGHLKQSMSATFFDKNIGFLADSPIASTPRKKFIPSSLNKKVSMSIERRRPI